jgi:hypothetical protein
MFSVIRIVRRGWLWDTVLIRAKTDIEHDQQELAHDWLGGPAVRRRMLRIARGEEFQVRLPAGKAHPGLGLEVADVAKASALKRRWD